MTELAEQRQALKILKSKVELAINEDNQLKASEYMIEVFGSRFPKGTSNDGDKTSKVFKRLLRGF